MCPALQKPLPDRSVKVLQSVPDVLLQSQICFLLFPVVFFRSCLAGRELIQSIQDFTELMLPLHSPSEVW